MTETIEVETFGDPRLSDRSRYQPVVVYLDTHPQVNSKQGQRSAVYQLISPSGSNRCIQTLTADKVRKHFPHVNIEDTQDSDLEDLVMKAVSFLGKCPNFDRDQLARILAN